MTTIYLVRHGEAEGNAYRRIHGQYDSLLTATGLRQVEALSRRFQSIPVDVCYSSDLIRTSLTARAVYVPKNLPLHRDPAFREVGIGRWEDVPFGYLDTFEPDELLRFNKDPVHWHVEGAETFPEYTGRFISGMTRLAQENPGKTIAIFCHGSVLRGVLARLFFRLDFEQLPYCDNTAVSKLFWDGEIFTYEYLNDASHLPEEISTFARQKWWRKGNAKDFNIWFKPMDLLPPGLIPPESHWTTYLAMLRDKPVGYISVHDGAIEALRLLPEHRGVLLEDQFLGQAVSIFRQEDRAIMCAREDRLDTPDLLTRYGFRNCGNTWKASLDRTGFHWGTPPEDKLPDLS